MKLRPHLFRFLSEASALFECHLYTLGSRDYAHALLPVVPLSHQLTIYRNLLKKLAFFSDPFLQSVCLSFAILPLMI